MFYSRYTFIFFTLILSLITSKAYTRKEDRKVFMNGKNISALTDHELENVHLRIDTSGHIFITARHYKVYEEESYVPIKVKKPKPC